MSLLAPLQTVCLIVLGGLLIAAAWQDLRTMRIANRISLFVIVDFAVWAAACVASGRMGWADVGFAVLCAAAVFGLGALAFALGAFGGGDVKLLAATSLFAGPALLPDLLLVMAFVGGALGFAIVAGLPIGGAAMHRAAAEGSGGTVVSRLRGSLPYAPAIAAGGLWTIAGLI
jgi:prepilin peptidase CpaA